MRRLRFAGTNDSVLSPLENDVLKILWPDKRMKVRAIYDRLKGKRKVALSSIAVILDRLHERSIVERQIETGRGGVRYIYFPKKNKQEFETEIVESTVNSLINKFGQTAISYFNERFSKR
ncbi:BlaI/MecI/CopY family transcriptional regulator [Candidatus Woesearchaeota archaeon]|nr:BlaI/MecI/CopY family transcriptional regulator [Candidatus Woesearchaeota archaeon]